MTGVHDMGGQACAQTLSVQGSHAPVFEHHWHARALAITLAAGFLGKWNLDAARHARESLPRQDYLDFSYYEVWLAALANLLVAKRLAGVHDLTRPGEAMPDAGAPAAVPAEQIERLLAKGSPTIRPVNTKPRFHVGQSVRARIVQKEDDASGHHTRLPGYVQGCAGTVFTVGPAHVFPDTNAHFQGEAPQYLYSVRFAAGALWPDSTETPEDEVILDLWESYLTPA